MKILYKIIFLLLIIISSSQAKDDNNVSSEDNNNSAWHFALSGGYSTYSSTIALYAENKFKPNYSILLATYINFKNEDYDAISISLKTYLINYHNDDSYLFEGLYYYAALNVEKDFDIYDSLTISPSASFGYGWHYFNHSLVFSIGLGAAYNYGFWHDPQTGNNESMEWNSYSLNGGLAYIF